MRRILLAFWISLASVCALAEIQVVNGVRYECRDGLCTMIEEESAAEEAPAESTPVAAGALKSRVLEGYQSPEAFVRWLKGEDEPESVWMTVRDPAGWMWIAALFAILIGGLAMNLTPCVLPMVPISLMVIGKSAVRGAWYGLGIALAYGTLGVAAAIGGLAFGTIQGNPWFNLAVAVVFLLLALALSRVFFIDFSRGQTAFAQRKGSMLPWLFAFLMGVLAAVLAGACVAPVLIGVLLLTAKLYAEGRVLSLALPFVLGVGMALPWPLLGAGFRVLPKPGAWMRWVNRLFALVVFGFAVWYGRLAWRGLANDSGSVPGDAFAAATPETLTAKIEALRTESDKPILVDCWATWCKNCAAMEKVLAEPEVREVLEGFSVIRLQAEDIRALTALPGFETIRGLPAFVIFYRSFWYNTNL